MSHNAICYLVVFLACILSTATGVILGRVFDRMEDNESVAYLHDRTSTFGLMFLVAVFGHYFMSMRMVQITVILVFFPGFYFTSALLGFLEKSLQSSSVGTSERSTSKTIELMLGFICFLSGPVIAIIVLAKYPLWVAVLSATIFAPFIAIAVSGLWLFVLMVVLGITCGVIPRLFNLRAVFNELPDRISRKIRKICYARRFRGH